MYEVGLWCLLTLHKILVVNGNEDGIESCSPKRWTLHTVSVKNGIICYMRVIKGFIFLGANKIKRLLRI